MNHPHISQKRKWINLEGMVHGIKYKGKT